MTSAPLNRVGLSVRSRSTSTSLSAGSGKEHQLETAPPARPGAENRCNQNSLILPPERPDLAGIDAAAQRCSEKGVRVSGRWGRYWQVPPASAPALRTRTFQLPAAFHAAARPGQIRLARL